MAELWDTLVQLFLFLKQTISQSDLSYVTALLATIVAVASFLKRIRATMYRTIVQPIGKFFSTFTTLSDRLSSLESKLQVNGQLGERLDKLEATQEDIRKELSPNSGTSIKDVINALAVSMKKIEKTTSSIAEQSQRAEVRQQYLFTTSESPIFETDNEGHYLFANKAFQKLIGRNMEELKGFGWLNIIHPDDRVKVKTELESAIDDRRNFELTYRIVCKEKIIYEVTCEALPLEGKGNGYIGRFETVKEIGRF